MKRSEAEAIISALVTLRDSATDEQALAVPALYPAWREFMGCEAGKRVTYGGTLYSVLQTHTAQAGWEPGNAPSLFAKVLIPDPDVIPEWEQPGADNGYKTGDRVTYNGCVWESCIDANVHEPTEQNELLGIWKRVSEAEPAAE